MIQADFLSVDLTSAEFAEVRGVILDPSCSGSGTAHSRMDHLLPSQGKAPAEQQAARLQSLAAFQVSCLLSVQHLYLVCNMHADTKTLRKCDGYCIMLNVSDVASQTFDDNPVLVCSGNEAYLQSIRASCSLIAAHAPKLQVHV